ncbi:hypothetical protein [Microvirga massiliensis]|uniref:hypothetical protein n=1 Tax=Microvirga massiliensis TaxID=1033741 RepID=UPI000AC50C58|nr:hypothetical protein [Microvirga massiliensis]
MTKRSKESQGTGPGRPAEMKPAQASNPIPDREHPGFIDGIVEDSVDQAGLPAPDDPIPVPEIPDLPLPTPFPGPFPPLRICGPVSGRYTNNFPIVAGPSHPPVNPGSVGIPTLPIKMFFMTVRVDVDRWYPQRRISVEASRLFPRTRGHAIAEVTSDQCIGLYRRRIEGTITYRDGDASLIPGVRLVFEARRTTKPFGYQDWTLSLIEASGKVHTYKLTYVSEYFDRVEFEIDVVENTNHVVTSYETSTHPNRPADLPAEVLDLTKTYGRAGFEVSMSPNQSTIPLADAGANGTWSDAEMHNAMVTYWSHFSNNPNWAMWVLFAAQHDTGSSLGGIMFDDIGPNHRQGTAIFTNSFIVDAPAGDPAPAAWIERNVYWTAVHEIGHAFNLAHAWQKHLGTPWIPLMSDSESRSFMNYPYGVMGGEQAFFSNFEFRFSDDELVFMRHAPRRFVQMGNEDWFVNHGFESPPRMPGERFRLSLRTNRPSDSFRFLEPVKLELKLENVSRTAQLVDEDIIADAGNVAMLVKREGGEVKRRRPFAKYHREHRTCSLAAGKTLYASHLVAASSTGWLIDQPGFYMVQAAVEIGGEIVMSDPLRIFVGAPASAEEEKLAPDYFCEDVARVLAFRGAPELERANDVLREVTEMAPSHPAAIHAAVALSGPMLRSFKTLREQADGTRLEIASMPPRVDEAAERQVPVLLGKADKAAETIGHIDYRKVTEDLAEALAATGETEKAVNVQKSLVETLSSRGVLKSVVDASERKLAALMEGTQVEYSKVG